MKIVLFAGGVGTRLWPLSRKKSPKQFEAIVGDKSTLQLAVERLKDVFSSANIFISTNKQYERIIQNQLPEIPVKNIILEPEMRDVGPAVGLLTAILAKEYPDEPMAILWSDHLVKKIDTFQNILLASEKVVKEHKNKIVFIAQKPRFANQNLGWIEYGEKLLEKDGHAYHSLVGFRYQPNMELAKEYFASGNHAWNLGYFVTTPKYLFQKYEEHAPEMYKILDKLYSVWGTSNWESQLFKLYPLLEKISFDNAVLEKLSHDEVYIVVEDLQWSDVGAWDALKEALQTSNTGNVIKGSVLLKDAEGSLVYNYNDKQLVIDIDADNMLVVVTDDVVLICNKDSVPKLKDTVKGFIGTEFEKLT
jgi:mannose-1-phosphate guanylyltransferase